MCLLVAGLALLLSCSRTEPQAAAVAPSATAAPKPSASSASVTNDHAGASAAGASSPSAAAAAPANPSLSPASEGRSASAVAAVEIEGKPWDASNAKVSAMDAWIGFVVDVESPNGERFSVHVKRAGEEGAHFMGSEVDVVYKRGSEWWRKKGEAAVAQVKRWQLDGAQPIVSLEWSATLLRDGSRTQELRVEGTMRNVPVVDGGPAPKDGLEKVGY